MDLTQQDPGAQSMSRGRLPRSRGRPRPPAAMLGAVALTAPPRTPQQERAPPSLCSEQNPQDSTLAMFRKD